MAENQEIKRYRVLNLPSTGLISGTNYELHLGGGQYRNYVVNDSNQLVAQDGKEFIECDTVDNLRNLDARQIWAIQNGYYKGVTLNGYYEKGDTPTPIDYYLSETTESDDGGSVFEVGGIKLEHDFGGVINILYYGAIADSNFDNTMVFNKCISTNINRITTILVPQSSGRYIYSDTLAFGNFISVQMDGVLDYRGSQDKCTIIIGTENDYMNYGNHKINIIADYNYSLWDDENYIGVRFVNNQWNRINIIQSSCFTYGVEFYGYGKGNVFNEVTVGHLEYNKAGLVLNSDNNGWVNENNFYGGSIRCRRGAPTGASGNWAWEGKSRYGIIIKSQDGYRQNSNTFHKPSIELRQQDAIVGNPNGEAVAIDIQNGRFNNFITVRNESNSKCIRTSNDSSLNKVTTSFSSANNSYNSLVEDIGSSRTTIIEGNMSQLHKSNSYQIYHSRNLIDSIKPLGQSFEATNYIFFSSKETGSRSSSSSNVEYTGQYLRLTNIDTTLGVNIDTNFNKRFLVAINPLDIGNQGRLYIVTRNSSGARIGTNVVENFYVKTGGVYSIGYSNALFNGAYQITGLGSRDAIEILVDLEFTDNVYSADIMIGKVSPDDDVVIKDFSIYCLDGVSSVNRVFNARNFLSRGSSINFYEENMPAGSLVIDSSSLSNLGWKVATIGGVKVKVPIPIINVVEASADTATEAAGETPTKAEFDALLAELRDLKTKLRTAGILAT